MPSRDTLTVQALRSDAALQVARHIARTGESQVAAARRLGLPQPTISKITRGRIAGLSLELLLRAAVRAGCPLVLQTGSSPLEAGVYVCGRAAPSASRTTSRVSHDARGALVTDARRMTPEQRLETQLRHSELVAALHARGRPRRK